MAATGEAAVGLPPAETGERSRGRWFRIVLFGLVLLVLGFTFTLMANSFYPCVPAAGSAVQPPLGDCAVFLTPWIGLALLGLVVCVIGYLKVA